MMSSISLFDFISVVSPDLNIFYASAADVAAVNPKGIKILLANSLITFFITGYPAFSNGASNLLRNAPYCIIFDNWVFDILILVDEWLAKHLRRLTTCLSVNNNL